MIAKTLFFTKTFQRIRREIYVRRIVFAIMRHTEIVKYPKFQGAGFAPEIS